MTPFFVSALLVRLSVALAPRARLLPGSLLLGTLALDSARLGRAAGFVVS